MPMTRMAMPSLLSQFAPRRSSRLKEAARASALDGGQEGNGAAKTGFGGGDGGVGG